MNLYRQGDILFRLVTPRPARASIRPADRIEDGQGTLVPSGIVAEGEVTGHAHKVTGNGQVFRDNESQALFVKVMEGGATITHEDHKPITLTEPGLYEVIRQREYDPKEDRSFRQVRD